MSMTHYSIYGWRPFLHPQPANVRCCGDRDPLIMHMVLKFIIVLIYDVIMGISTSYPSMQCTILDITEYGTSCIYAENGLLNYTAIIYYIVLLYYSYIIQQVKIYIYIYIYIYMMLCHTCNIKKSKIQYCRKACVNPRSAITYGNVGMWCTMNATRIIVPIPCPPPPDIHPHQYITHFLVPFFEHLSDNERIYDIFQQCSPQLTPQTILCIVYRLLFVK